MAKKDSGESKVHKVMHEFKHGELHSGSKKGPKVTSSKQAIAIAMSESNKERDSYPDGNGVKYPRI